MILLRPNFNLPLLKMPMHLRIAVLSLGLGISVIGILSKLLIQRRRKKNPQLRSHLITNPKAATPPWKHYNGDINQVNNNKNSPQTTSYHRRQASITSEHLSTASTLTLPAHGGPPVPLSPQQLGVMGMEALETALGYWEDALRSYTVSDPSSPAALTDAQEGNFTHLLQKILDKAYHLQDHCSQLFLYENSVLFRCDSTASMRHQDSERRFTGVPTISSADSFVSAQAEVRFNKDEESDSSSDSGIECIQEESGLNCTGSRKSKKPGFNKKPNSAKLHLEISLPNNSLPTDADLSIPLSSMQARNLYRYLRKYDESALEYLFSTAYSMMRSRKYSPTDDALSIADSHISASLATNSTGFHGSSVYDDNAESIADSFFSTRSVIKSSSSVYLTANEDASSIVESFYSTQSQANSSSNMAREALKWKDSSHDLSERCTFYSANSEIANIHDFDDEDEIVDDYLMYKKALKLLETEMVPCRISRTALLKCPSETDFLAKLHCIRQAFPLVFELEENVKWFTEVGRSMLVDLFTFAKKDPKGCVGAYEEFLRFTAKPENWPLIEDELADRGLTCFTFYDTVLDFIILDAFEDLENPPSSVNAVIQNRWLSSGFKESALGTAVWSVLKAKRRLLRYSKGFISHFYSITEYLSPTLAWGFFGPNEELKEICLYFKEEVVGFISDIFSLDKVRYTSPQELAVDIMAVARERYQASSLHLQLLRNHTHC